MIIDVCTNIKRVKQARKQVLSTLRYFQVMHEKKGKNRNKQYIYNIKSNNKNRYFACSGAKKKTPRKP